MTTHWLLLDLMGVADVQMEFDIFEHMAARGLHYAYATINVDYPSKTLGLWDFAADYVETHFNAQQRELLDANSFWGNHSFAAPMKLSFPMVFNEFEVRSCAPRAIIRSACIAVALECGRDNAGATMREFLLMATACVGQVASARAGCAIRGAYEPLL